MKELNEGSTTYSNLQEMRQDVEEVPFSEYVEMYEEDSLTPGYLDGLRGARPAGGSAGDMFQPTDDTHYGTFEMTLAEMGAETFSDIGGTKITSNSIETETHTWAEGNDIVLEMDVPNNRSNKIRYEFQGEVPGELTELDKAMVGYTWQFFDELLIDQTKRSISEFTDSIISRLG